MLSTTSAVEATAAAAVEAATAKPTAAKAATAAKPAAAKAATAAEPAGSKAATGAAEAAATVWAGIISRRAWSALEVRARLEIWRRLEAAPRRHAAEALGSRRCAT